MLSCKYLPSIVGCTSQHIKRRALTLWRWGYKKESSLLGTPAADIWKSPQKIEAFSEAPTIDDISCGRNHSAFIVDGELYTFGSNQELQLGRETGANEDLWSIQKVYFDEAVKLKAVSCGAAHTAAVTEEGYLYTFGWGGSFLSGVGGLGSGSRESYGRPHLIRKFVDLGETVDQVCCGKQHTLVLTKSGRIFSCGKGEFGRLGRGKGGDQPYFEEVEFMDEEAASGGKFVKISCGASHSAALTDKGDVWVWGRNDFGQLGLEDKIGDLYSHVVYPTVVAALQKLNAKIEDISSGCNHMLALAEDGAIYFWGGRAWLTPRLANGNMMSSQVGKASSLRSVKGGGETHYYSMATSDSGELYTWGKPRSSCLIRDVHKDANEPCAVDAAAFDNQKVKEVACSYHRALAIAETTYD